MSTTENIKSRFKSLPRLFFLTLRTSEGNPKGDSPNCVHNILKKYSTDYFIVKEKDHKGKGFHYHAIWSCSALRTPTGSFYKKGWHMHNTPLGDINPSSCLIPESLDHVEYLQGNTEDTPLDEYIINKGLYEQKQQKSSKRSRVKKSGHVGRCVDYLLKEFPMIPVQYQDYIYVKKNALTQSGANERVIRRITPLGR